MFIKNKYLWLGFILILAVIGLTYLLLPKPCPDQTVLDEKYLLAICVREDLSEEEIIERLMSQWLQRSIPSDVPVFDRIDDYKIDSIEKVDGLTTPDGKITFKSGALVVYSILPSSGKDTYWIAGHGFFQENGWITDKNTYVGLIKHENGVYELLRMGPCPTC